MANLSLRHIYKVYPNGTKAVSDFNMEIKDKEFIVFVGPSGCGKSTTLRMIAGLEDITAGELYIDNELVNDTEPKDRDIAMVFQNYALYPHMTVYDNMAFGLKLRHIPAEEIHKKVLWAADVLKLTDYLDTKPRAMSGGQRQRVALGRAILRNPKVFLLDEPLSNLDAKLRTEMRAEIAKLHQQLQTTFIYVTHDQIEAMTLGTRVVVMKLGKIQQIDTPQNLYQFPENKFVAGFIGTPQMNFFEATLKRNKEQVDIKFDYCDNELHIPFNELLKVRPKYLDGKEHVYVGLRCENISLDPEIVKKSKNLMKIKVSHFEELGNETLVYGDLNMKGDGFTESSTRVIVKSFNGCLNLKPGQVIDAAFDMKKAHFFNKENENTIVPRVPVENVFDCDIKDDNLIFLKQTIKLPNAISVKDVKNAELFVPTNAISFDGGIPCKVACMEEIKGVKLCYLELNNRIFFAIVDKDYKAGTEVKINIDFKKITIKVANKDIVEPLNEYDEYLGSFTNVDSDKKSIQTIEKYCENKVNEHIASLQKEYDIKLGELGYSDALYKSYKNEYKEQLEKNKQDRAYRVGTQDLGKDGRKKAQNEFELANEKAKTDYEAKVKALDEKGKKSINSENAKKADELRKELSEKVLFCKKEFSEYKNLLSEGSKHISSIAHKDEEILVKKSKDKIAFASKKYKKSIDLIEKNYEGKDDKVSKSKRKEELINAKNNFEKEKNQIGIESKLFFANINGIYVPSQIDINKKIIQALGVGIFRSNYRYRISHYSYKIVDKDGIKAKVVKNLDYGNEKFIQCDVFGQLIYVNVQKPVAIGNIIYLDYSLENSEIYENKFDIRLY